MNRILRYIVDNPGEPDAVSYNTGLGDREARSYAISNARSRNGRVIVEYTDGTREVFRDYREDAPQSETTSESVPDSV